MCVVGIRVVSDGCSETESAVWSQSMTVQQVQLFENWKNGLSTPVITVTRRIEPDNDREERVENVVYRIGQARNELDDVRIFWCRSNQRRLENHLF